MTEWILTSSVLMLLVLLVRALAKGSISLRLQYALWALVLVRLLVPINFSSSSMSLLTLADQIEAATMQEAVSTPEILPQETVPQAPSVPLETSPAPAVPGVHITRPTVEQQWEYPFTLEQTLGGLWVLGMAILALVMTASNVHFGLRLKRSRIRADIAGKLPVYYSGAVDSPCLFGLFRPSIYLPTSCQDDPEALSHVLAHEQAHYRHLDHIWSVLRCVCLCVHWYNPLVWICAVKSKADGETACDEAAIRLLGEDQRIGYGKTLISLSQGKPGLGTVINTATTMDGSQHTLKQRIALIVHNPKTTWITLLCVILAAALIFGFTFIGPQQPIGSADQMPDPPIYNDGGIEGSFLYTGRTLYVWDYTSEAPIPRDGVAQESFTVESNDNNAIPCQEGAACRLEVGTVVYDDSVYDYLYTKPGPIGSGLEYAKFVPVLDMEQWWQESTMQPGYYAYYANQQLTRMNREAFYLYFDGNGNGTYISGGLEIAMTVSDQSLRISRNYSLDYRVDGNVVSTSFGSYMYMGTEKPVLPVSSALTAGQYVISGEMGSEDGYFFDSPNYLLINQDGTGSLRWEGETYPAQWTSEGLYVSDKLTPYYYDEARNGGVIALNQLTSKVLLYFNRSVLYTDNIYINTSPIVIASYQALFEHTDKGAMYSRMLSCTYGRYDMDLSRIFYNGIAGNAEPNQEELEYLVSQGFDPIYGIGRITQQQLEGTLQEYFGITMAECELVGLDRFEYYNGSYFFNHTANEKITIEVLGVINADSNSPHVLYRYTNGCMPGYESIVMEVSLEIREDGSTIITGNSTTDYALPQ